MIIGNAVHGHTVAQAWTSGLSLFREPAKLYRYDSERGVAFDVPGLTITVDDASDSETPSLYRFPYLVDDYLSRIFGAERSSSMIHQRLFRWPAQGGGEIDQIQTAVDLLRKTPDTRAAVFSLWSPDLDLHASFPVSPVAGTFRVIGATLVAFVTARSVDYWMGAVAELLTFARLQANCAAELGLVAGQLVYHAWSAHMYESDCLAHLAGGGLNAPSRPGSVDHDREG